ncbi:hypothetical protein [Pacificibacter marinus]|uniref:hypothetical protein n=1 Tax=Pacificibacter marinus TaxID=658057 RepID=UPI001C070F2A|nr:hypothetical protein [Pacificibacter marinus]MBU2866018.1 hypothetical protein [Pacificibacter marinus]
MSDIRPSLRMLQVRQDPPFVSAQGWERSLDGFRTSGSFGPFTSIDTKGGLRTFAAV